MEQSIIFSSTNGRYGNAYDLNLSTTPGAWFADDNLAAALIGQYYLPGNDGLQIIHYPSNEDCGKIGFMYLLLDPAALGLDSSIADNIVGVTLNCAYWHYQGTIRNFCWYNLGTVNYSSVINGLGGWMDGDTTSGYDNNNAIANVFNQPSYIGATCQ